MKKIGVVTFSRSEYGGIRPVFDAIEGDSEFDAILFVSGMHLPEGIAKSLELGTSRICGRPCAQAVGYH